MFSKDRTMAKQQENNPANINIIRTGTSINGDINCSGDIRIDGKLIGSLICEGKVVIGTSGMVDGQISCKDADFSGTIKAKLVVRELLTLRASSKFNGEIHTKKLSIEPGATFTGSCNMGVVKEFEKPKTEPVQNNLKQVAEV